MTDTTPTFRTRRTRLPMLALTADMRCDGGGFVVLVARRAQRVNNRGRDAAARFERVHLALRAEIKNRA